MINPYLDKITIKFCGPGDQIANELIGFFQPIGQAYDQRVEINRSDPQFHPSIFLDFQPRPPSTATVDFALSDQRTISVAVDNSTGETRHSPHSYRRIGMAEVQHRLAAAGIRLAGIDHAGFDLPWFAPGLHPTIVQLREQLSASCLYHRFPTGEAWDFIIPGDGDEILGSKAVDYGRMRRPKFEIVSFEKASTPLVQFDLQLDARYETLRGLFPEALDDPELRNLWVYLENPYGMDVCLVANETGSNDWSNFFKGSRISKGSLF